MAELPTKTTTDQDSDAKAKSFEPFAVELENLSGKPLRQWVTVGLPETATGNVTALASNGLEFPAVLGDHCVHILADLTATERLRVKVQSSPKPPETFRFAEWVIDEPAKLFPFFLLRDGASIYYTPPLVLWAGGERPESSWHLSEQGPARIVANFRTRFSDLPVFVEGWLRAYSNQEAVEFCIRVSYGSTANDGQPMTRPFGMLSMVTGEKPHLDYRVRKGLHEPIYRADLAPSGDATVPNVSWEAELAVPQVWMRNRTIENTGVLLCLPPPSRFSSAVNDQRARNLEARQGGPIVGVADVWQDHYLAFGSPPAQPRFVEISQRRESMFRRMNQWGHELDPRPYAQPPNSGQTGEQPDFGASRCELAASMLEPWAIYDLRYSVQAWLLRPYAAREPNGAPLERAQHPNAHTYNLRPDERFSAADMLGWPNPVPYFDWWSTSDSQHRSDNLLFGLYALTRDESLRRTIRDILTLQQMDLSETAPMPTLGSGMGSPRGWGRPLIALCHAHATGFPEAEAMIRRLVARSWQAASFRRLPESAKVRVLSDNEAKYGWNTSDGTAIRAWLPWQESIAVMGLYAAWRLLGIQQARDLCVVAAKTITSYGWVKSGEQFFNCYAVRWRTDQEGEPLPTDAYTLQEPNYDVFVYGMHRWVLPSMRILRVLEPAATESQLADQIIAQFPAVNWDDAAWWAV